MDASPIWAETPDHSFLIYDGDCGFCTTSANFFAEQIAGRPRSVAPWQALDLATFGLREAQTTTAAYWVDANGAAHRAHKGIAKALIASPMPWPIAGWILALPPMSWLASVLYKVVARNRHKLPGSTDACKVDL